MITLSRIRLREIRLPLREPFRISSGVVSERRIPLLELTDASGVTVWSECVAGESPNYTPETIDTAWIAISQWVAPRVLGASFAQPGDVHDALDKDFRGHNMAKAGVEMGMWALARRAGGPAARRACIGGTRDVDRHRHLARHRAVARRRSSTRRARRVAEGYRKVKIKIKPGSDVEFVRAAREALGADGAAHGRREQRLHARRRRSPRRARRARPHDDRAAAGLGRHRSPRRAAAAAQDADLPRRVDHVARPRRSTCTR